MVLIINLAVTAFLAGLTWYLQIVHYPLFIYLEKKSFLEYHIYHLKKNTYMVFVPMLVEGTFAILFTFDYPLPVNGLIAFLCLCISTAMWLVTFAKLVPLQDSLTIDGWNEEVIEQLIKINWIRTIGWSVKTLLLMYCIAKLVFLA
jgi:hypothetical protein